MRKKIVLMTLALFLLGGAPTAAQTFGFGAHAGVSVPTGNYGDVVDLGFLGGIDLSYPLTGMAPGLWWHTSADAIAHSASNENVDGGYLFLPLMTGLRFDIPVGPLSAFATGQLGLMLTQGPDDESLVGLGDAEMGTSFGYNFGGGIQFTENVYAGVRYWPLGDRTFEYEAGEVEREVSFLDVYIGFGVR